MGIYNRRSSSDIVVPSPLGSSCVVMIPTSRFPCSMSEICPRFMSNVTAMSVCVHPLRFLNTRMRFPI